MGPLGGGGREMLSKLKNREEFEGGLKKEEFEETSNISSKKQGGFSTGGGTIFFGWPEYIPLREYMYSIPAPYMPGKKKAHYSLNNVLKNGSRCVKFKRTR